MYGNAGRCKVHAELRPCGTGQFFMTLWPGNRPGVHNIWRNQLKKERLYPVNALLIRADKRTYVNLPELTCGDYCNSGSVGYANVRSIEESFKPEQTAEISDSSVSYPDQKGDRTLNFSDFSEEEARGIKSGRIKVLVCRGLYSSESIYLLDSGKTGKLLDRLEDYPSLDDELVSAIEMEWEAEAWESWLRSDLSHEALKVVQAKCHPVRAFHFEETLDHATDELLWECYRKAMEKKNEYPTPECSGVHIDVKRISETFALILWERRNEVSIPEEGEK